MNIRIIKAILCFLLVASVACAGGPGNWLSASGPSNYRSSWIAPTVTPPLIDYTDILYFWDWRDYTTGVWPETTTGISASQTTAINQPVAGASSVEFDGDADYLSFNSAKISSVQNVTVFIRANTTGYTVYGSILSQESGDTFEIRDTANYGLVNFVGGAKQSTAPVFTNANATQTYCVTMDSSEVTFFTEGSKVGDSVANINTGATTPAIRLGMSIYGQKISVNIKYLAIYGVVKTPAEISAITAQLNALP